MQFEQIQLRDSEVEELEAIIGNGVIPLEVAVSDLDACINNCELNKFSLP